MSELPEPDRFVLHTFKRIRSKEHEKGLEALTGVERIIFRAQNFSNEVDNGDLDQFFYNTDSSMEVAEQTACALETLGAPRTAAVLRSAAAVVCRADAKDFVGTWRGYLDQVDPEHHLSVCEKQIGKTGEGVDSVIHAFIIQHRQELEDKSN